MLVHGNAHADANGHSLEAAHTRGQDRKDGIAYVQMQMQMHLRIGMHMQTGMQMNVHLHMHMHIYADTASLARMIYPRSLT
jgi:uncharacterized protein (DUF983 family)